MLNVKTPEEVYAVMEDAFPPRPVPEEAALEAACGRVLFAPVTAGEYIPGFDRSTVDGYAVRSADTFGCSDAMPAILTLTGEIAMGSAAGKPVFGLPGHPVAAFFVSRLFALPLLDRLMGRVSQRYSVPAVLTEAVSANHGRAQYMGVFLSRREGVNYARPIRGKSGLITALAGSDGYFRIPRDCEGMAAGASIDVWLYD